MRKTILCLLLILVVGVVSARGLNTGYQTKCDGRKPRVEVRFRYSGDLDNKPVEITLIRKNKEYSKQITSGNLNYCFYNLKPGKYSILLTFLENGKKPYRATYGEETWLQEGIDINSKGRVSSSNRIVKDNEITVYRKRRVIVDLFLTFKGKSVDSTQPDSGLAQIHGQFFKEHHFYRKEENSVYYKLHFERTFRYGNIDKKKLEELERLRMEFIS